KTFSPRSISLCRSPTVILSTVIIFATPVCVQVTSGKSLLVQAECHCAVRHEAPKPMDESQRSGISFAVASEFADDASESCVLSADRLKGMFAKCTYAVRHRVAFRSTMGGKSHVRGKSNDGSQRDTRMG